MQSPPSESARLGSAAGGSQSERPSVRAPFSGQRVLVVGPAAESAALRALLREFGARVMASSDVEMALTLVDRFAIDVLVVDPELCTAQGEPFLAAVRRGGGPSAGARTIAPLVADESR